MRAIVGSADAAPAMEFFAVTTFDGGVFWIV
jgi:hypothetical protein